VTLAPHELRLGRLLMVAFLLTFLHRVLTTALSARGGRLVLLAGLVLAIAAVYEARTHGGRPPARVAGHPTKHSHDSRRVALQPASAPSTTDRLRSLRVR
jgi:uncharacterized membrane protein